MKNIALLHFKDVTILPEYNAKYHYIDTSESIDPSWLVRINKDHGSISTRVLWAPLEMNGGLISDSVISSVLPYATRELKESIRSGMSCDISEDPSIVAEAIFMAQRTLIGTVCHADLLFYIGLCIRFWRAYLRSVSIDYIVSTVVPHSLSDYLLTIACRQLFIPFISQVNTGMASHCWYLEMGSGQHIRYPVCQNKDSLQDLEAFINAARVTSKSFSEAYTPEINLAVDSWKRMYKAFLLSASESARGILNYKNVYARYYDAACEKKPIPDEYRQANILYLHYQPEATSSPLAKSFYDQRLIADTVLAGMSDNDILIVKEHPTQFFSCGIQESTLQHIQNCLSYRSMPFYKYFESLPRTYFCPRRLGKQKLFGMRNARIWSATGTVLLEAYVNNVDIGLLDTHSIYNKLHSSSASLDQPRYQSAARVLAPYVWKSFRCSSNKYTLSDGNFANNIINKLIAACPRLDIDAN